MEIIPIDCTSSNSFRITETALDSAYQRAETVLNLKVKGLFITNPSNPLGTSLTQQELNLLLTFSTHKNLHIVSDEIYAGTVFSLPKFTSIVEALDPASPMWTRVHLVSSLSKDLGLPGFRIGSIYSNNETLLSAATKMSSFGLISSQSQFLLCKLLADAKFVEEYGPENRRRLRERRGRLVAGLGEAGIACLESNAGLFCWVDMRRLLRDGSFEAEMEMWDEMVAQFGLNVSPGSSFHSVEPGWFRVCFANMTQETLGLSVGRIRAFVDSKLICNGC